MNVYAKFRCASLRIKKALEIFRELITTTTTTTTRTRVVAFVTRLLVQESWLCQGRTVGGSDGELVSGPWRTSNQNFNKSS